MAEILMAIPQPQGSISRLKLTSKSVSSDLVCFVYILVITYFKISLVLYALNCGKKTKSTRKSGFQ
jgi:hypothetical protein